MKELITCHMCGHTQEKKIVKEPNGSLFGTMTLNYMLCKKCGKTVISFTSKGDDK